jgi:hypothetical protein
LGFDSSRIAKAYLYFFSSFNFLAIRPFIGSLLEERLGMAGKFSKRKEEFTSDLPRTCSSFKIN